VRPRFFAFDALTINITINKEMGLRNCILGFVVLTHSLLAWSSYQFPKVFPEELDPIKTKWMDYCADLPHFPTPSKNLNRSKYEFKSFKEKGLFKAFAVGTFLKHDFKTLSSALTNYQNLPLWIMPGINQKDLDGGRYFVNLEDLSVWVRPQNKSQGIFTGEYQLSVLGFKAEGRTSVFVRENSEPLPECIQILGHNVLQNRQLFFRMVPRKDVINFLVGSLTLVEKTDGTKKWNELWIRVITEPSTVLYNLLPETWVQNELKQRSLRIYQNLLEYLMGDPLPKKESRALYDRASM
jgi:hypothetical protein